VVFGFSIPAVRQAAGFLFYNKKTAAVPRLLFCFEDAFPVRK
jgi:hypothetical protein